MFSNIKKWWFTLAKSEQSALAMFAFIFLLITLFITGNIIGQAIYR